MKFEEMFSAFEIIAFEPVVTIFPIYDENTCDRQSTCYQTVLRFQIGLREIFSNSIFPRLMKNLHKSATLWVSTVFGTR